MISWYISSDRTKFYLSDSLHIKRRKWAWHSGTTRALSNLWATQIQLYQENKSLCMMWTTHQISRTLQRSSSIKRKWNWTPLTMKSISKQRKSQFQSRLTLPYLKKLIWPLLLVRQVSMSALISNIYNSLRYGIAQLSRARLCLNKSLK